MLGHYAPNVCFFLALAQRRSRRPLVPMPWSLLAAQVTQHGVMCRLTGFGSLMILPYEVKEYGNLRFDVLQSVDDPTDFLLIEVYRPQPVVR